MLGPDEVWLFASEGVSGAPALASSGQQANTVTVKATDDFGNVFTDDDQAHYLGVDSNTNAAISIVKSINATDPRNPTAQEDANDPLDPVVLQQGAIPTFTYQVRNLGADSLTNIVISDDAATDASGDDFAPAAMTVKYRGTDYNSGDIDRNNLLDPGETWLYTSAGVYRTAAEEGGYINVARVTAGDLVTGIQVMDDDTANYVVTRAMQGAQAHDRGGSIFTMDGTRVTHGFELHCDPLIGPNNLQVNFDGNSFHLEALTSVVCYDDPAIDQLPRNAPFDTMIGEGIGRFNGVDGYAVRFVFTDAGEPGSKDFAEIEIRDPNGNLVLFAAGNVSRGNQQAHPENKALELMLAAEAPAIAVADTPIEDDALAAILDTAKQQWLASGVLDGETPRTARHCADPGCGPPGSNPGCRRRDRIGHSDRFERRRLGLVRGRNAQAQ